MKTIATAILMIVASTSVLSAQNTAVSAKQTATAKPSAAKTHEGVLVATNTTLTGGLNQFSGSVPRGVQQGPGGSPTTIACNTLQFEVAGASPTGAPGIRRPIPITCRRTVDQESMALLQDAMTNRRMPSVTLSLQGSLVIALTNADVSNVTFTADNGTQIVEIAFTSERWEITHAPSGSKVASDSWNQK
jgi:hypothetical protein